MSNIVVFEEVDNGRYGTIKKQHDHNPDTGEAWTSVTDARTWAKNRKRYLDGWQEQSRIAVADLEYLGTSSTQSSTLSREEIIAQLSVILISAAKEQTWSDTAEDVFLLLKQAGVDLTSDPRWNATAQ